MGDAPVPEVDTLEAIYGAEADGVKERYSALYAAFEKQYGQVPELFARAPGRVNLIGEHIDYEGYGVLPMAIRPDTIVAIARGGTQLTVANLTADKYPTITFDTDPSQAVDTHNHTWANYFLSAYKGVFALLEHKGVPAPEAVGLQVMVHGVVPTGSGLSSSAAMVCSSMLAVLGAYGIATTKAEVAEFACTAERHVGVTSGGMDQAISMTGMDGVAKMVEFNPVRVTDVVLPPGATFVIANSLSVSNKAETAPKRYNMRVVECRLASALLALGMGVPKDQAVNLTTLKSIETLIEGKYGGASGGLPTHEAAAKAVSELLHEEPYTQDEVEAALGVKLEALYEGSAASLRVLAVNRETGYRLRQRALHVYGEAHRVTEFKQICDGSEDAEIKLAALGALMDGSHASCAKLYECSCAELDELVADAKAAGAIGARLTGAGWGGCTVSLVRKEQVPGFLAAIKEKYYGRFVTSGCVKEEDLPEMLFASKPSAGAAILKGLKGLKADE